MEQIRPIYPEYDVIGGYMKTTLLTHLRIKRHGIWYITPVARSYEWTMEYNLDEAAVHAINVKEFHREIYCYEHGLEVDPENPIGFVKCPTQEEESERLKNIYAEGI